MATRRCRKRCARHAFPGTTLHGEANLLIMPNVEAANITYNLLKMVSGEGVTVGPFLLGRRQAGAYPDAGCDRAADHQHDGGGVGGSAGGEGDVMRWIASASR